MEQTVLREQTIQFEDEDQVIKSQSISVLPPQTEEKPSFLEDPITPEEETKNESSSKIPRAKKYLKITDAQRRDFIDAVENKGEKIINAAKLFDINYSSAKSILNIYKNEGRSTKKTTRTKTDNVSPKTFVKTPESNEGLESVPKTTSVSTQTNEEDHQDPFLLFKDNLLMGSEKRSNPYDSISYHEVSRFTGNINDYSGSQLQNNINQLSGFQNIIDPNNKSPQDYQTNQPIFTSINYISLPPNIQNVSAPNLQYPPASSSSNFENNGLLKPTELLYSQNTQAFSSESGSVQFNPNVQGLNLFTSFNINQPLFSNNQPNLQTNLDYSQLQRLNIPSPGSLREELPLQNKEDYSSGLKNFASMNYTGGDNLGQAQVYQHQLPLQLNENSKSLLQQGKTEIRYLPPISMVYMPMSSNPYEQQNAAIRPVFQMIGNYAPQQNTYAFYGNNQNSNNNNQNNNNYPQNN